MGGLFQINKNYLIGSINLFVATMLAAFLGLLLVFQIKAYELNVAYSFSWRFFLYDPFASRLILIVLVSMITNIVSAVVSISNLYSHPVESNAVIFSMSSILWIVVYMSVDYAFQVYGMVPIVLLILTLIVLLSQQLLRWRIRFLLYFATVVVVLLPILGRLTDSSAHQQLPERIRVIQ